jgi:hypothetical protein
MESYRVETILRERARRLALPEFMALIIRLRNNLLKLGFFLDDFEACVSLINRPFLSGERESAAEILNHLGVKTRKTVTVTAAKCSWLAGKMQSYEESLGIQAVLNWLNRKFVADGENPVNELRRLEHLGRNVYTRISVCPFKDIIKSGGAWLEEPEKYFTDQPSEEAPDSFDEDFERIYRKRFAKKSLFRFPMTMGRLDRIRKKEEDIMVEAMDGNIVRILEERPGIEDTGMVLHHAEFLAGQGRQEEALKYLISAYSASMGRVNANFMFIYTRLLIGLKREAEAVSTIGTFMKSRDVVLWHPDTLSLMRMCRELCKKQRDGLFRACYWEKHMNEAMADFRQNRYARIKASWKTLFHDLDAAMSKAVGI